MYFVTVDQGLIHRRYREDDPDLLFEDQFIAFYGIIDRKQENMRAACQHVVYARTQPESVEKRQNCQRPGIAGTSSHFMALHRVTIHISVGETDTFLNAGRPPAVENQSHVIRRPFAGDRPVRMSFQKLLPRKQAVFSARILRMSGK